MKQTTEANEPIEVDDDVSHEASENKEQGKFQSRWASLYTWLTYDKDKNSMKRKQSTSNHFNKKKNDHNIQCTWHLYVA
jgi:hypothetical protein